MELNLGMILQLGRHSIGGISMATKKEKERVEEEKVKELFSKLRALATRDEATDLSPRQCLEDCLKGVKAQVEGAEAGYLVGYTAGMATRQRHDKDRKHTPKRLENLKVFLGLAPTLSAEEIFEALEEQEKLQKQEKQEENVAPTPTTNPMLQMDVPMQTHFDAMSPAEQEIFSKAYLRTYFEGYQKGFQVIAPKNTAISQKPTAAILHSELEVELDQDTIDLLANAVSTTPKKIQEAILLYARVDKKTQDDLLPESFPESNELDSDNGKLDTSANPATPPSIPNITVAIPAENNPIPLINNDIVENALPKENLQPVDSKEEKASSEIAARTAKRRKKRDRVGYQAVTKAPEGFPKKAHEGLPKYEKEPKPIKKSEESGSTRPAITPNTAIPAAVPDSTPLTPGHGKSESLEKDLHSVTQALKPSHPASQSGTESSIKPIAFSGKSKAIFERAITADYAAKEKQFAHRHLSYKKTREKQMKLIDDVRKALNNNPAISEKDKGVVLEAVMSSMLNHLKKEHRWTQVFGTKSRLETVLRDDIKIIKKDLGLAHSNPLQAMWLIRTHLKGNADLTKDCFKILGEESPGHRIQKPKG